MSDLSAIGCGSIHAGNIECWKAHCKFLEDAIDGYRLTVKAHKQAIDERDAKIKELQEIADAYNSRANAGKREPHKDEIPMVSLAARIKDMADDICGVGSGVTSMASDPLVWLDEIDKAYCRAVNESAEEHRVHLGQVEKLQKSLDERDARIATTNAKITELQGIIEEQSDTIATLRIRSSSEKPVAYAIECEPGDPKLHSLSFWKQHLDQIVTAHGGKVVPLYRRP